MRHSIKRISKSALSVILALMMVVSTMVVGMVTVGAASITKWYIVGSQQDNSNMSWTINDDHMITGSSGSWTVTTNNNTNDIYFKLIAVTDDSTQANQRYLCTTASSNSETLTYNTASSALDWYNGSSKNEYYKWSDFSSATNSSGKDVDLIYKPDSTATEVTFTVSQVGLNNYVTVTDNRTSGGGTTLGTAPDTVLNETQVMFYIASYIDKNNQKLALTNGNKDTYVQATYLDTNKNEGYILIDKTKLSTYTYITNNYGGWEGSSYSKIAEAKGGEYFVKNNSESTTSATTGLTTLSSASANLGSTTPITLTTVSDKTTSAYGSNLYVQYYVDKNLVNTGADLAASTSGATYDLDVSGYAAGSHTIQTVLTDGNVYYISDTDTFTIASKTNLAVPTVTLTANGVITSDTPVTLNIASSDGSTYPDGATFELVNSSGTTIDNITLSSGNNTLKFTDNIPDGKYTVKVSAGDDYNPASSTEFSLKSVQLYAITLVETVANLSSITSSPATSTYEGNTVKVTVTPDTGYECTGLTVMGNSTVPVTKNDDGTYSFTMPGEAVTVTPTISEKTVANITVSSNNVEYGTAVRSTSDTIYVGDTFDVTVNPAPNYALKDFTINGCIQGATSGNITTFTATEQNVSVTANFTENKGVLCDNKFIVYGTTQNPNEWGISNGTQYLDVYYNSTDKAYYATIPFDVLSKGKNIYFALSSSKTDINQLWWRTNVPNTKTINVSEDDPNSAIKAVRSEWNNYKDGNNGQFVQLSEILDTVTAVKVKIEISSVDGATDNQGTYTITPVLETVPEGRAKVYAKDGTYISKNGSTSGTFNYGDTKVVTSDTVKLKREDTAYNIYSAEKDSYLTIQTTMDSTYSGYGFYVYAFCINGDSYPAVAKAGGVYETTYKVTGEEENSIVEITPVYFNTKVEDAGDYISVYVDASQLKGKWGNTISCYSYYYYSGKNAYDTTPYPGQPMLLGTNGLYYTRVPRYAYENGKRKVNSEGNPYAVSGVTLNSFSESELHGTLYSYLNGKNYQTYDYDDFKYIADLGFDTVKFVIEYRDKTTNQLTLLDKANNHPDKSDSDITPSVYEGQNGWNDFYDFDGNLTDILGNVLTAEQKTQSPIYIVSTGNQNTSMGEWSTVWYVFDQNGHYVTQGIPSDFITRNADGGTTNTETPAYQAIVNANLTGVPVQICYESQQDASTSTSAKNTGVRVDGRWYYTTSKQETPVDVKVQYTDDISTGAWTIDSTGISGTATIDGVTEKVFTDRNVTAQLDAVAKSGYIFVEWGTVDDNGENYTKLSNIKSASAEFMIDTSYHLVARFVKVEDGSLVITHEKYTGPNYIGGGGYYYVSAVVYNSDGTVNSTYDLTEGSITIPQLASLKDSNCTIKITMVTKMKGDNTFIDWYMLTPEGDYDNITQDEAVWGVTGKVSQEVTVAVNDLYSGSELVVNTLQYYSDIAKVTKDAVLNYKYYNRFGEERTYTVKVTLDDTYIDTNGYSITDKLIYDNAPAIEDLYKDCIWTITDQTTTKIATTATIWGTHNKVTYNVTLDDLVNTTAAAKVEYSSYLYIKGTKEFYTAPAKKDGVSFAYWLVEENGKEVAKCYSNEFNLKILGNYTITAFYSNDKTSSLTIDGPSYTREQFTDETGKVKSDYLYVDFIVAYMDSYGILLNGDLAEQKKYHTGLIVEFDKNKKVPDVDYENAKLNGSLTDYAYEDYSGIEAIATNSEKTSGSLTVDGTRAIYKFEIDNRGYNNKNRIDYYVKFNNTKNFRHYVMKAYYYVYYTDKNGNTVFQKTDPVYFCLFEIGNSTADL